MLLKLFFLFLDRFDCDFAAAERVFFLSLCLSTHSLQCGGVKSAKYWISAHPLSVLLVQGIVIPEKYHQTPSAAAAFQTGGFFLSLWCAAGPARPCSEEEDAAAVAALPCHSTHVNMLTWIGATALLLLGSTAAWWCRTGVDGYMRVHDSDFCRHALYAMRLVKYPGENSCKTSHAKPRGQPVEYMELEASQQSARVGNLHVQYMGQWTILDQRSRHPVVYMHSCAFFHQSVLWSLQAG